jgi:hypothetical protein
MKHKKINKVLVSIIFLMPTIICASSNNSNKSSVTQKNTSINKIDITSTVFGFETKDLGTFINRPTDDEILFILLGYVTNHEYDDVINELEISSPTLENEIYTIVASIKPASRTYIGSISVTYQLKSKIDLSAIFTENLSMTFYEDELFNLDQTTIDDYFLQHVVTQYLSDGVDANYDQIRVSNVDFSSAMSKYNNLGTITIKPARGSNVYTGSAIITFPEVFTTLNTIDFSYKGDGQTFIAPQEGDYILEA